MERKLTSLIIALAAALTANAQRSVTTINEAWLFQKENESEKSIVSIPHCWNAQDAIDEIPGYYRGKASYQKSIYLKDIDNKSYYIHFEAVNQTAELLVNGKSAGKHTGGYTGFTFDITPYIHEGANELVVKADNSYDKMVAPLSADFTFMGGIYRDIELITTGKVHLSNTNYATNGVYISTPLVSKERAVVNITSHITNGLDGKATYFLCHTVTDPQGAVVKTVRNKIKVTGKNDDLVQVSSLEITSPQLWSTADPRLYHVLTSIQDKDGNVLDEVLNRAGMRWFSFDPDKGFFLNGEHLKLIGTSRHQDYRGRGNALTDEIHELDVLTLKEMGGNFLRISHYPEDPVLTQMCDKLGIIVSVEIPIVNACTESEEFQANCLNMLREMIWQDYNSPSVCIWAYMNEVLLRPWYNKKKEPEKYSAYLETVHRFCKEINDECKRLDPCRATMLPCHGNPDIYEEAKLTEIPDILGWNYYKGWYSGTFDDFKAIPAMLHQRFPSKSNLISEFGADMDIRLHSSEPERYDYTCDYSLMFHKAYLPVILSSDELAGGAVWNLNDFLSEGRTEGEPRINNKGLLSMDREKKDPFYYYQATLSKEPAVFIGGKSWKYRGGLADEKGISVQPVTVFANTEKVELIVNGESLGIKAVENSCAEFTVPFKNGRNTLAAQATVGGKQVADYQIVDFKTFPDKITSGFTDLNVFCSKSFFDDRYNKIAWIPEKEYTPGSWGFIGGVSARPKTGRGTVPCMDIDFLGTDNDALYQRQRKGLQAFKADVPDGQYYITLYIAEWDSDREKEDRIFDVVVNNVTALPEYDITREAGAGRAIVKRITANVKDGQGLYIEFIPVKGETVLNAIRIYKAY